MLLRVWFRPRIMRDVSNIDYSTSILGYKTSMPIYITATALGKLGHPEGEVALTRAAGKHNVIQMVRSQPYLTRTHQMQIPTLASCSFDEMVDAAIPGQTQFMQLSVCNSSSVLQLTCSSGMSTLIGQERRRSSTTLPIGASKRFLLL